eukprot:1157779-Pelagomonas_calceolata.AAC.2
MGRKMPRGMTKTKRMGRWMCPWLRSTRCVPICTGKRSESGQDVGQFSQQVGWMDVAKGMQVYPGR